MKNAITVMTCFALCGSQLGAQEDTPTGSWSDESPHQVSFVSVAPDIQLEVLDWGGSGSPLVFLAGLTMNAHAFDDLAPRFTDSHRVFGITRRGHGASSWPSSDYRVATLERDLRIVLDSLGLQQVVLAGHSLAGAEMTRLAAEDPERIVGLIYIDAGHDLTLIDRLRLLELCPTNGEALAAMERSFENLESFRRTQTRIGDDGSPGPYASGAAMAEIMGHVTPPDYSQVRAPALGIYYVPEWVSEVYPGGAEPSEECLSASQRYIYGGIADFAEGMQRGTVVALQDSQHNLHLASPDEVEATMRLWLAKLPVDDDPSSR